MLYILQCVCVYLCVTSLFLNGQIVLYPILFRSLCSTMNYSTRIQLLQKVSICEMQKRCYKIPVRSVTFITYLHILMKRK